MKMNTKRAATPTEPNRIGRLLGKFWNQIVKSVTAAMLALPTAGGAFGSTPMTG
jgi:hypothetical protein